MRMFRQVWPFNLVFCLALGLLAPSPFVFSAEPTPAEIDFFEAKIRPVLVEHCYSCHSAESKKVKGSLYLDSRAGVLTGGDTGPVLVPGQPEKSSLIRAVHYTDDNLLMPPKKRLSPQQVTDLEAWVKMGAPDPRAAPPAAQKPSIDFNAARKFWSFQSAKEQPDPAPANAASQRSRIDRFIDATLAAKNLVPVKRADKRTLIRRATFDLTGLPPAPDDVAVFEKDASADAFAHVVDRLLSSPHYGERWGRHWLDVVRYADTAGETADYPVPLAYRYRNYVIDAFNQDKPYDQFVREQIAGDLLALEGPREKYAERVVATGYLAVSRRFGFDSENYMHLTIEDTLDTLGKSILGLSIACARCHDHKFDPISAADYYALFGIFSSSRYAFPGSEEKKRSRDMVPLVPPQEVDAQKKALAEKVAPLETELKRLDTEKAALDAHVKARVAKPPLASGVIDNGGKQDLSAGKDAASLHSIAVKTGEMIELIILPKTNHGADSTLVEFEIAELGGAKRVWNLTREIVPDLFEKGKGNPHSDAMGNPGVWYFLDSLNGGQLFSKYTADAL